MLAIAQRATSKDSPSVVLALVTGLALVIGALWLNAAEARNVYRWVAEDGTVTYADRPLSQNAEVYVPLQRVPVLQNEVGDPVAERRKRKCIDARNLLEQYSANADIRRVDANTGRVIRLSDEQRNQLILESQQDVDTWCDADTVSSIAQDNAKTLEAE